jgi:sugar phosphate isomerase/epimerase
VLHLGTDEDRRLGLETAASVAAAVAKDYERAGVRLVLENTYPWDYHECHHLGGTPEEFGFLFEIDSPAVRFCLDTGHANMSVGTLPFIERLGPVLGHVHVADNGGRNDEHLAAGEGTVDWDATLSALLDTGFRGPYVVEFPESRGIELQKRFIENLRRLDAAHREAGDGGA